MYGFTEKGITMIKTVLFDLDGTVTDSGEGIVNCVSYALFALGIEETDRKKLESFIGPPLKEAFRINYSLTEEQAQFALSKYRERYNNTGIYENKLYDGIEDILKTLYEKGVKICLATSKPQIYAERILEYFKIKKYFFVVCGSELDGRRTEKTEVINYVLGKIENPKEAVMVGDRIFDISAAHKCGIKCIGAKYGYPKENELSDANADYIVRDTKELKKLLLKIT